MRKRGYWKELKEKIKAGLKRGFTYDGCTHSPDFDFKICCDGHDYDYQDLTKTRLKADNDMFLCMARKGWTKKGWKGKLLAPVYWTFVRIFGHFYWKEKQYEAALELVEALPPHSADGPN